MGIWQENLRGHLFSNRRIMGVIDGMHNFPRQVAEKENSQDRALNIPDLIEACQDREMELQDEIILSTGQKKRIGGYKRFFYHLPVTDEEWTPFKIQDYKGNFLG